MGVLLSGSSQGSGKLGAPTQLEPPAELFPCHPDVALGFGFRVLVLQGLYWDNGKENGNYYLGFGVWGFRVSGFQGFGVQGVRGLRVESFGVQGLGV